MKISSLIILLAGGVAGSALAAPLAQSTFTQVIKDVNVVAADTKAAAPAQVSAVVKAPDLVRTGPASRAELTAPDQTITRIGANSVFAFEPQGRSLDLQQGSVLFYSPKGNGGGTIKSGGASAAVLGSTMICVAGADGSFKTILLEGKHGCTVTLKNGQSVTLHDGQMVVVQPGGEAFGPVLDIDLAKLVGSSLLVNGFSDPLGSMPLIQIAINDQQGGGGAPGTPGTTSTVDNNTYSTFTTPVGQGGGKRSTFFNPVPTFPANQPNNPIQ
jgi:FecR protein